MGVANSRGAGIKAQTVIFGGRWIFGHEESQLSRNESSKVVLRVSLDISVERNVA
jgi:hypothetical protein